jgi:rod shape-determining protein MreC
MALELFNPQAKVVRGDLLVSSGSRDNTPFVPGVPIGEIISVKPTPGALTRSAIVRPFANLTALDLVGVVVEPPRKDPRNAVLPPPPTPTPTPTPSGSGTPLVSPSPTTSTSP